MAYLTQLYFDVRTKVVLHAWKKVEPDVCSLPSRLVQTLAHIGVDFVEREADAYLCHALLLLVWFVLDCRVGSGVLYMH